MIYYELTNLPKCINLINNIIRTRDIIRNVKYNITNYK